MPAGTTAVISPIDTTTTLLNTYSLRPLTSDTVAPLRKLLPLMVTAVGTLAFTVSGVMLSTTGTAPKTVNAPGKTAVWSSGLVTRRS